MPTLTTYAGASRRGFTGEPFSPIVDPVIYYDFFYSTCYPGTGNTVFDLSGNNNNATIANATFSNTSGANAQGSFGFNGINSTITTAAGITALRSASNARTFQIWARVTNSGSEQGLWTKNAIDTNFGVEVGTPLYPETAGKIETWVTDFAGGSRVAWGSNPPLTSNVWYLITFITQPNPNFFQAVYLNTTSLNAAFQVTYGASGETNAITIGAYCATNVGLGAFLTGRVGAFIAYDRALSASDINNVFAATKNRFGY